MKTFAYALATLWVFWGFYVLVMGLYRAHLQKRLGWATYALGAPFILFGILVDFIINFTIAAVIFFDLPREPLVTGRLQRYVAIGSGLQIGYAITFLTFSTRQEITVRNGRENGPVTCQLATCGIWCADWFFA